MSDAYDAITQANLAHYVEQTFMSIDSHAAELVRNLSAPSSIYKPSLSIDGNQWCALYGKNLQEGIAGFGDTPEQAMDNFNYSWNQPLPTPPEGDKP
jgi:hypothetical protein